MTLSEKRKAALFVGRERLWGWFGFGYASWLTMPRVLMHEMPDEWQDKMAALLEEWDETWETDHLPSPSVSAKSGQRFTRWPSWVLDYRRPCRNEIDKCKALDIEG